MTKVKGIKDYTKTNLGTTTNNLVPEKTVLDYSVDETIANTERLKQSNATLAQQLYDAGVSEKQIQSVNDDRNFLQKLFNLKKNQGIISGTLELMGRPAEALQGFLAASTTGEDAMKLAFEGLTGQKNFTLKDVGFDLQNPLFNAVGNMAFEMYADPFNFINMPLKTIYGKTLKPFMDNLKVKFGQWARKSAQNQELYNSIVNGLDKFKLWFKDTFNLWKDPSAQKGINDISNNAAYIEQEFGKLGVNLKELFTRTDDMTDIIIKNIKDGAFDNDVQLQDMFSETGLSKEFIKQAKTIDFATDKEARKTVRDWVEGMMVRYIESEYKNHGYTLKTVVDSLINPQIGHITEYGAKTIDEVINGEIYQSLQKLFETSEYLFLKKPRDITEYLEITPFARAQHYFNEEIVDAAGNPITSAGFHTQGYNIQLKPEGRRLLNQFVENYNNHQHLMQSLKDAGSDINTAYFTQLVNNNKVFVSAGDKNAMQFLQKLDDLNKKAFQGQLKFVAHEISAGSYVVSLAPNQKAYDRYTDLQTQIKKFKDRQEKIKKPLADYNNLNNNIETVGMLMREEKQALRSIINERGPDTFVDIENTPIDVLFDYNNLINNADYKSIQNFSINNPTSVDLEPNVAQYNFLIDTFTDFANNRKTFKDVGWLRIEKSNLTARAKYVNCSVDWRQLDTKQRFNLLSYAVSRGVIKEQHLINCGIDSLAKLTGEVGEKLLNKLFKGKLRFGIAQDDTVKTLFNLTEHTSFSEPLTSRADIDILLKDLCDKALDGYLTPRDATEFLENQFDVNKVFDFLRKHQDYIDEDIIASLDNLDEYTQVFNELNDTKVFMEQTQDIQQLKMLDEVYTNGVYAPEVNTQANKILKDCYGDAKKVYDLNNEITFEQDKFMKRHGKEAKRAKQFVKRVDDQWDTLLTNDPKKVEIFRQIGLKKGRGLGEDVNALLRSKKTVYVSVDEKGLVNFTTYAPTDPNTLVQKLEPHTKLKPNELRKDILYYSEQGDNYVKQSRIANTYENSISEFIIAREINRNQVDFGYSLQDLHELQNDMFVEWNNEMKTQLQRVVYKPAETNRRLVEEFIVPYTKTIRMDMDKLDDIKRQIDETVKELESLDILQITRSSYLKKRKAALMGHLKVLDGSIQSNQKALDELYKILGKTQKGKVKLLKDNTFDAQFHEAYLNELETKYKQLNEQLNTTQKELKDLRNFVQKEITFNELGEATERVATKKDFEAHVEKKSELIQKSKEVSKQLDKTNKQIQKTMEDLQAISDNVSSSPSEYVELKSIQDEINNNLTNNEYTAVAPLDEATQVAIDKQFFVPQQHTLQLINGLYDTQRLSVISQPFKEEWFSKVLPQAFVDIAKQYQNIYTTTYGAMSRIAQDTLGFNLSEWEVAGYVRHTLNPSIVSIEAMTREKQQKLKSYISGLFGANTRKALMAREYQGAISDINAAMVSDFFNTSPVMSLAISLDILPEAFKRGSVFKNILDNNLLVAVNDIVDIKSGIADEQSLNNLKEHLQSEKEKYAGAIGKRKADSEFINTQITQIDETIKAIDDYQTTFKKQQDDYDNLFKSEGLDRGTHSSKVLNEQIELINDEIKNLKKQRGSSDTHALEETTQELDKQIQELETKRDALKEDATKASQLEGKMKDKDVEYQKVLYSSLEKIKKARNKQLRENNVWLKNNPMFGPEWMWCSPDVAKMLKEQIELVVKSHGLDNLGDVKWAKDAQDLLEKLMSGEADNFVIHRSIVNTFNRYAKISTNPNGGSVWRSVENILVKTFKKIAVFSLGFHARNVMTNYSNAYLAGISPLDMAQEGLKVQKDMKTFNEFLKVIDNELLTGKYLTADSQIDLINNLKDFDWVSRQAHLKHYTQSQIEDFARVWDEFHDLAKRGIVGNNQFAPELLEFMNDVKNYAYNRNGNLTTEKLLRLNSVSDFISTKFNKFANKSFEISKRMDDMNKIALYRLSKTTKYSHLLEDMGYETKEMLSKLESLENAVKELQGGEDLVALANAENALNEYKIYMKNYKAERFTKFVLFDYNNLSAQESSIMKALFPFYTWARKNVEFHLRNFGRNTKRYGRLFQAMDGWKQGFLDEDETNEYSEDYLPIWRDGDNITYLKVNLETFDEADEILGGRGIINALSPVIKTPIELITGYDFFTGKNFNTQGVGIGFGLGFNAIFNTMNVAMKTLFTNYTPTYDDKKVAGILGSKFLTMAQVGKNLLTLGQGFQDKGVVGALSSLFPSVFSNQSISRNVYYNEMNRQKQLQEAVNYYLKNSQ